MTKIKQHFANDDGWCDWDTPLMRGYKMYCCDCNLTHEVDYNVLKVTEHNSDGSYHAEELSIEDYRVQMRMKRNNRSTGQMRRNRKSSEYEAGIKDAAEHIREIEIFDNNGIADSVLQLLYVQGSDDV